MRAAEHALRCLAHWGAKYLFGIPGGTVNPFYDALADVPGLEPLMARHETAAAYMAAAWAERTGRPGVVIVSSGPGSSNLLTGVASAMRERTPLIVLTGHVPSSRMGYGGAQEASAWTVDMVEAFKPFTKRSVLVTRPEVLGQALHQAMLIARAHPRGPVHLALPLEVQMGDVGDRPIPDLPEMYAPAPSEADLAAVARFLEGPGGVLFCGSGIRKAGAWEALEAIARACGWPVVTTPAGKGAFPEVDPQACGVYGLAGDDRAVAAVTRADRVLVLGSSLGELATGNWHPRLAAERRLIQVDVDPAALGRHFPLERGVVAELGAFLEALAARLPGGSTRATAPASRPRGTPSLPAGAPARPATLDATPALTVPAVLDALATALPADALLVSDIGEHMTWALHHWRTRGRDGFQIAIDYGGMGSGIATSLGCQLAEPGRTVVCLTGDGCLAMHGGEIATAAQFGLRVLFVVVNNASYGMVRWGHQLQYGRTVPEFDYPAIDVASFARSLGARTARITRPDQVAAALSDLLAGDGPAVLEVVDTGTAPPPMGDRVRFLQGTEGTAPVRLSFLADPPSPPAPAPRSPSRASRRSSP